MINITLNGKSLSTNSKTILDLANELGFENSKSNLVLVVNGFQTNENLTIKDNDTVSILEKNKVPSYEELEFLMTARHTPNVHIKMKNSVVGIAGLGGLGSNIAVILARMGVGKLILADFDIVEPTNLNRQHYFIKHLGMTKCNAIKELISEINPYICVETNNIRITEKNALEIFSGCDVVCEAFDNPECKAELVNTVLCENDSIKIVSASGMAGLFSANDIITKKINNRFYICGDGVNSAKDGIGLMSPRVSVCAGHQANQIVRLLIENN